MKRDRAGEISFLRGQDAWDEKRATLVFIHGAGESALLWEAQVQGLAGVANTLALDLPGHGKSGGAACSSVPEYAAWVADFITRLGLPHPVPCGLSMGGAITQQLLLDHGGLFGEGIIVSSGARLRVWPGLFDLIVKDPDGYVAWIDRMGFSPKTAESVKRPFLEDSRKANPKVAWGDFKACDAFDVMPRLAEIRQRVLVISAEDDRLTPPKYGEYLERHIPGARRVHIRDAGHFVPIENPAAVNAAIASFLRGDVHSDIITPATKGEK